MSRPSYAGLISVLFLDGTVGRYARHDVYGACITGDPTVYVLRKVCDETRRVYVIPGESVAWMEVPGNCFTPEEASQVNQHGAKSLAEGGAV